MLHGSLAMILPTLAQAGATPGATPGAGAGAGNPLVVWGVVLVGVAMALFLLEVFVPSGGLIGFFSAAALVAGVVMFFRVDTTLGLVSAMVCLAALPLLIGFAIKIWPDTWVAQLLTLKSDPGAPQGKAETVSARRSLVGRRGQAVTDLRPVGTCLIDGRREECLAHRGVIEAGTPIEVVEADGMQVKVRAVVSEQ